VTSARLHASVLAMECEFPLRVIVCNRAEIFRATRRISEFTLGVVVCNRAEIFRATGRISEFALSESVCNLAEIFRATGRMTKAGRLDFLVEFLQYFVGSWVWK